MLISTHTRTVSKVLGSLLVHLPVGALCSVHPAGSGGATVGLWVDFSILSPQNAFNIIPRGLRKRRESKNRGADRSLLSPKSLDALGLGVDLQFTVQ